MYYSWGSMLRTVRAAVAVMILGGIGLTVPPQTRDMLAFLDNGRLWPALSFQLAMVVLAGSAWFWSRAALAARFGIDDDPLLRPAAPDFDWTAYNWLPRLMLVASFLVGAAIAFMSRNPWTIAGAVGLAALGIILVVVRRRGPPIDLLPAPRGGLRDWIPGGVVSAAVLLALGLIPLALGVIESFTFALKLPNHLAAVFPGPGIAVLLLGLMIGPLVALAFLFDGLTL